MKAGLSPSSTGSAPTDPISSLCTQRTASRSALSLPLSFPRSGALSRLLWACALRFPTRAPRWLGARCVLMVLAEIAFSYMGCWRSEKWEMGPLTPLPKSRRIFSLASSPLCSLINTLLTRFRRTHTHLLDDVGRCLVHHHGRTVGDRVDINHQTKCGLAAWRRCDVSRTRPVPCFKWVDGHVRCGAVLNGCVIPRMTNHLVLWPSVCVIRARHFCSSCFVSESRDFVYQRHISGRRGWQTAKQSASHNYPG